MLFAEAAIVMLLSPTTSPSCCWSWSWCILLGGQRTVRGYCIRYALHRKKRLWVL